MEAFDTHDIYKEFEKAGVPPAHSEVFLEVLKENTRKNEAANKVIMAKFVELEKKAITKEEAKEVLATKSDIKEVRAEIKEVRAEVNEVRAEIREVAAKTDAKIDALASKTEAMIANIHLSMFKYTIGLLLAISGIMATIIKLMIIK